MKYLVPLVTALAPIALAVMEHHNAQSARDETVEVARVLSEACMKTTEVGQ